MMDSIRLPKKRKVAPVKYACINCRLAKVCVPPSLCLSFPSRYLNLQHFHFISHHVFYCNCPKTLHFISFINLISFPCPSHSILGHFFLLTSLSQPATYSHYITCFIVIGVPNLHISSFSYHNSLSPTSSLSLSQSATITSRASSWL